MMKYKSTHHSFQDVRTGTVKVRTKIIILLASIIVLFFLGMISVTFFSFWDIQTIQIGREELIQRLFKSIITLKSQPLYLFHFDFSRWDEMADFANHRDDTWAEKNLVAAMPKYHSEVVWVFGTDYSLTYHHSRIPDIDLLTLIPPEKIPAIFQDRQYVHFYALTTAGIMEIRGATIFKKRNLSQDGIPQGYFFVGHIWDDYFIKEIADMISDGHVEVTKVYGPDNSPESISDLQGNLYFSLHFKGWDGTPLQHLKFKVFAPFVKKYVEGSIKGFMAGTAIWFIVFLLITWALIVWVNRPLKKISYCLKNEDPRLIDGLLTDPSEFGHISRMIQEFFKQKEQLKYSADHDAMTGVLNRRGIVSVMNNEISRAKRHYMPFSVIMADLDHFKRVNDTFGHLTGDLVLKEIAARFRSELRVNDLIGRYGGEEFLILAPGSDAHATGHLAERLKERISNHDIQLPDGSIRMTVSMGISQYQQESDLDHTTLIARADEALYQSKENGRNCITINA